MYTGNPLRNENLKSNKCTASDDSCAEKEKDRAQEKYQVTQQQTVVTYNQNCGLTTQWNLLLFSITTFNLSCSTF